MHPQANCRGVPTAIRMVSDNIPLLEEALSADQHRKRGRWVTRNSINSSKDLFMLTGLALKKRTYLSGLSGYALASLMTSNVVLTTALSLSMASTEQYFSSEIRMAS